MNNFMFLRVIETTTRFFHKIKLMIDASLKQTHIKNTTLNENYFFNLKFKRQFFFNELYSITLR